MGQSLEDRYFQWLCSLVCFSDDVTYNNLLSFLYDTIFTSPILMDDNRAYDGCNLRYHFGDDEEVYMSRITYELDYRPCSVLEMMIALALRLEQEILYDPEKTNICPNIFWAMIDNMDLLKMSDDNFDVEYVFLRVNGMLDRTYDYDGKYGLFSAKNPRGDFRKMEIWYQAQAYLIEHPYI